MGNTPTLNEAISMPSVWFQSKIFSKGANFTLSPLFLRARGGARGARAFILYEKRYTGNSKKAMATWHVGRFSP